MSKIHTFSNGATVEDNRHLGLSLWLRNFPLGFLKVHLTAIETVTISVTSADFEVNELGALKAELLQVATFIAEIEEYLNPIENPKANCHETND